MQSLTLRGGYSFVIADLDTIHVSRFKVNLPQAYYIVKMKRKPRAVPQATRDFSFVLIMLSSISECVCLLIRKKFITSLTVCQGKTKTPYSSSLCTGFFVCVSLVRNHLVDFILSYLKFITHLTVCQGKTKTPPTV